MAMLRTGLVGKHDDFLGTAAVRINVGDNLQACLFQLSQSKVGHFETLPLCGSDDDASLLQHGFGLLDGLLVLYMINHRFTSFPLSRIPVFSPPENGPGRRPVLGRSLTFPAAISQRIRILVLAP